MSRDSIFVAVFGIASGLLFAWLAHGSPLMAAGAVVTIFQGLWLDRRRLARERIQGMTVTLLVFAVVNLYWMQRSS